MIRGRLTEFAGSTKTSKLRKIAPGFRLWAIAVWTIILIGSETSSRTLQNVQGDCATQSRSIARAWVEPDTANGS